MCYLRSKSEVDDAVCSFAQTFEWPEMSPLVKFFVAARLDFAWEIASVLNTGYEGEAVIAYPALDKCKTSELLEWLLIDIWPYGCGRFLQTQKWITEQAAPEKTICRPHLESSKAKCVA